MTALERVAREAGEVSVTRVTGPGRRRRLPSRLGLAVLFIIAAFLFVLPLYWMVLSSLRPQSEMFGAGLTVIPTGLSLDNYGRLLAETPFIRWFINTVTQSLGYATLTVAICSMGGYALAKYHFRFRTAIFITILVTQMLPFQLLIVSLFVQIVNLGLVDHYLGAILPLAAHPIGLFFMRQHMLGISDDLLAAGRVDGASEYRLFWSVVLPNVRPALATLFILFALEYWNNLLWPLIVFRQADNMPLAVGLASMVNQYRVAYDLLLAGSALATLPVIGLFFLLRRQFMAGTAVTGTGVQ
jgi:ABC-type glycerol-3-phosphate transport system permease component